MLWRGTNECGEEVSSMVGGDGELFLSRMETEDAGLGWRAELVREGAGEVCVGGSRVGGKGCGGVLKNRSSS